MHFLKNNGHVASITSSEYYYYFTMTIFWCVGFGCIITVDSANANAKCENLLRRAAFRIETFFKRKIAFLWHRLTIGNARRLR